MRRRPRPFMLSASTGDGAALVVIVGLLCLPLSAFVALPAMLLTAKLVDSNINWLVLVLIALPIVAASVCFIATPILAIVSFAVLIAALYFVRRWLKHLPETSQIRCEFKRFRKIAICVTVVCYIGFLIVLLLENYTTIMTIMTCAKMQNNAELLSSADTNKETFAGAGTEMQLNADRFDLYYLLAVQGEAVMNLLCSMDFEMWYTLGNANQTFYLTAVNNGVKSTKYLSADGFMSLIAAVNESLEAFIKTEFSELHLTPNVVAGLKRYRLLSDLDSSTLSSIDSVSLDELDYVELA